MWDVIVSVPNHCLCFYFTVTILQIGTPDKRKNKEGVSNQILHPLKGLSNAKMTNVVSFGPRQISTAHAQPSRGARDLAFRLTFPLDSLLV